MKTQFGTVDGHIAIVHLLDTLEQCYFSNLHIMDEGGYYEQRDAKELAQNLNRLQMAIEAMTDGLREFGMNAEAAEDPNILLNRIERIAELVRQKIFPEKSDS